MPVGGPWYTSDRRARAEGGRIEREGLRLWHRSDSVGQSSGWAHSGVPHWAEMAGPHAPAVLTHWLEAAPEEKDPGLDVWQIPEVLHLEIRLAAHSWSPSSFLMRGPSSSPPWLHHWDTSQYTLLCYAFCSYFGNFHLKCSKAIAGLKYTLEARQRRIKVAEKWNQR